MGHLEGRSFDGTGEYWKRIVRSVLKTSPVTLLFQQELQEGREMEQTSAGKSLMGALIKLQEKYERELKELKGGVAAELKTTRRRCGSGTRPQSRFECFTKEKLTEFKSRLTSSRRRSGGGGGWGGCYVVTWLDGRSFSQPGTRSMTGSPMNSVVFLGENPRTHNTSSAYISYSFISSIASLSSHPSPCIADSWYYSRSLSFRFIFSSLGVRTSIR